MSHDYTAAMLNRVLDTNSFKFRKGKIHIGNNVFISSKSTILYGVNIGNNVIIGAGSIVTKDIPDNSIVAGAPAKFIKSFDDYISKMDKLSKE